MIVNPVATLADEHGGRCQIAIDDYCYVLYIKQQNGKYKISSHIFQEAFKVLKTLSGPSSKDQKKCHDCKRKMKKYITHCEDSLFGCWYLGPPICTECVNKRFKTLCSSMPAS